jgi:hypothetical protein
MARSQSGSDDTLQNGGERNGQQQQDGGEKGDKSKNGKQEGSVGFWSSDLRDVRMDVFKNWGITSMSFCPHCSYAKHITI